MENRWSIVGGVLSIIAGTFGMIGGLALMGFAFVFSRLLYWAGATGDAFGPVDISGLFGVIYGSMGAFLLLVGVLALIGGIFAIRRKLWGLALAGSIAATLAFFPLGAVAIVFTAMARAEFLSGRPVNTATVPGPPQ